jgi:hypothetical protein
MRYQVFKSNASEWYRGEIEAESEVDALEKARRIYPSKNQTDIFRVVLITPEIQREIDQREAADFVRQIERMRQRPEPENSYARKRQKRLNAYHSKRIARGGTP